MFGHLSIEQKADIMKDALRMQGLFHDNDLKKIVKEDNSQGGPPSFLIKWVRTFADNENLMSDLFMELFKLMSSNERKILIEKMWTAKFYDEKGVPMFIEKDGVTINDEMFDFLKRNLDSIIGQVLSAYFNTIEISINKDANLPHVVKNVFEKLFGEMKTESQRDGMYIYIYIHNY